MSFVVCSYEPLATNRKVKAITTRCSTNLWRQPQFRRDFIPHSVAITPPRFSFVLITLLQGTYCIIVIPKEDAAVKTKTNWGKDSALISVCSVVIPNGLLLIRLPIISTANPCHVLKTDLSLPGRLEQPFLFCSGGGVNFGLSNFKEEN